MVKEINKIQIGWAVNVDKETRLEEKIYPITHSKAVVFGEGKILDDVIVTSGYDEETKDPFLDPMLKAYIETSIQLSNINIDTYDYQPYKKYNTDNTCTGGAIASINEYFITVYPVGNRLIAKFIDTEGREFVKKKINGTWDSGYSSSIY